MISTPAPGHIPEENETLTEKDAAFIAAFSMTAKTWTRPQCSLKDDWLKKLLYLPIGLFLSVYTPPPPHIDTLEYHPAITKNEIWLFGTAQTDGEDLMLSKIRQTEKKLLHNFTCSQNLKQTKNPSRVYRHREQTGSQRWGGMNGRGQNDEFQL